jgi:choline monooxygenase
MKNSIFPKNLSIHSRLETAFTLSADKYSSPVVYEREKDAIFNKTWQWVGLRSELKNNGDYLSARLGEDAIVIVLNDQKLYGFYNVCKHRGGPLIKRDQRQGNLKYGAFICQYHGWTYRLNGELRGVPSFDRAELFDKADFGLMPIDVVEWNGCIFVRQQTNSLQNNIAEVMDGIEQRMPSIHLSDFKFHQRISYSISSNWKVYVDNYLEGYHIPIVHPELARLIDYKHYITELNGWHSLQQAPFRTDDSVYNAENGQAWYWFVFPNLMLNILPNRMQVNIIEPNGPEKCVVHFDYYYTDPEKAVASGLVEDDLKYSEEIQQEDIEICEAVQLGLKSPAYNKGRFSPDREEGVWHFQELYKAVLEM